MAGFQHRKWLDDLGKLYSPTKRLMQAGILRLDGFIGDQFFYDSVHPAIELPELLAEHFHGRVDAFAWYTLSQGLIYEFDHITPSEPTTPSVNVSAPVPIDPRDPMAAFRQAQQQRVVQSGRRGGGKYANNPWEAVRTIDEQLRGHRDKRIVVLFQDTIWDFPGSKPENQELVPRVREWAKICLGSHLVIFAGDPLPQWTHHYLSGSGIRDLSITGPTTDEIKARLVLASLEQDQDVVDWNMLDDAAHFFQERHTHPTTGYRAFVVQYITHRNDRVYDTEFLKRNQTAKNVYDYSQIDVTAFEQYLTEHVIGQEEAKRWAITQVRRLQKQGMPAKRKKPIPIIRKLFAGPSGVGKTEIAKVMCKFIFQRDPLIIPFTSHTQEHDVAKLIGAPPGYVGYGQPTDLSRYLQEQPYGLIVLDEFERGHRKVQEFFMNVLQEGFETIPGVARFEFGNTVIIATSNAGKAIDEQPNAERISSEERRQFYEDAIRAACDAALLRRLDGWIIFERLNDQDRLDVARLYIGLFVKNARSERELPDFAANATDAFFQRLLSQCPKIMGAGKIEVAVNQVMDCVLDVYYDTQPTGAIQLDWTGADPTANGQDLEVSL